MALGSGRFGPPLKVERTEKYWNIEDDHGRKRDTIGYIMILRRLMHVSILEAGYYIPSSMGLSGLKIEINKGIIIKLDDRNIGISSIDDLVELRKTIDEFLESKYRCNQCKFSGMNELHLTHHKQIKGHYEDNN